MAQKTTPVLVALVALLALTFATPAFAADCAPTTASDDAATVELADLVEPVQTAVVLAAVAPLSDSAETALYAQGVCPLSCTPCYSPYATCPLAGERCEFGVQCY